MKRQLDRKVQRVEDTENKDKAKGTTNNFKIKYKFKLRKEVKLR